MSAKDKAKYKDFIEVIYISKENSITQEFFNYLNAKAKILFNINSARVKVLLQNTP